ncbi:MAG: cytochrome c biogenesis CcdA family protein [Bacilli bacterium]
MDVTLWLSFVAGFLSFISPCCLPVYPAFLSYITGMDVQNNGKSNMMFRMLHTAVFLLGFSVIFIALGLAASQFGYFFTAYSDLIRQIGAVLVILFGLMVLDLLPLGFLNRDVRFQFQKRPAGFIGTFLIGLAFAAGWTPCTGPILGSVFGLMASNPSQGMLYMIAYILGFAVPFFILSFSIDKIKWLRQNGNKIRKIGGVLMIVMGIILYFDWLTLIIIYLMPFFNGWTGF